MKSADQARAKASSDRAMDAVGTRFDSDAVGYATAQLDRARFLPDSFRELAEKNLSEGEE